MPSKGRRVLSHSLRRLFAVRWNSLILTSVPSAILASWLSHQTERLATRRMICR
jgi:hypothetical protein